MNAGDQHGRYELLFDQFPGYVQTLTEHRIIDALDVYFDERKRKLPEKYLQQNDIDSLLHCALYSADQLIGVLCIEQRAGVQPWSEQEKNFAVSIADLISQRLVHEKIGPRINEISLHHETLMCRLGGDEFTVLIYDILDQDEIVQYAESILHNIRRPFAIDSMVLEVDASIGIALYPMHGKDSHELLRSADVAMYAA